MEIVYGVPWIEVEFGQRPEGWKIFNDEEICKSTTLDDSHRGALGEGYLGPCRPETYYKIPKEILPPDVIEILKNRDYTFTGNHWNPEMKSHGHPVR